VLVDTHCHLDPQYFPEPLGPDDALARARAAGVGGFVVIGVGTDLAPARAAVALAKRIPDRASAAVGVHPHDATVLTDEMLAELSALARHPQVAAVGEMGLDYHYMSSPMEAQKEAFRRQIALARRVGKPIVVHTRAAPGDTLDILAEEGAREVGGVIHCFSEDKPFASRALDLGFDLSFSGIVTFKSAASVHEVAAWAPGDRILIETDSPYLAPIPLRGRTCEPAYLVHTAKRVAALRGESVEELTRQTAENTRRRFGLGAS